MADIQEIFNGLTRRDQNDGNSYVAATIPSSMFHKLGMSEEGYPVFFIQSSLTSSVPNVNLDLISVQFGMLCRLKLDNGEFIDNTYTVVSLKTDEPDFISYFLHIVNLIINKIGETPSQKVLVDEIGKLVELFRQFSKPATKTIQGLWAELFVIAKSSNPEYLINSWHASPGDTFDFNDGYNKVEVKSTSKSVRKHKFSLDQLSPNSGSDLVICSLFAVETGQGDNVFSLKEEIEQRIASLTTRFRLNDIFARTLGSDFEKAQDIYFDTQRAIDSYRFYHISQIPKIDISDIPPEISNVHFDCDLSGLHSLAKSDNIVQSNNLFLSL